MELHFRELNKMIMQVAVNDIYSKMYQVIYKKVSMYFIYYKKCKIMKKYFQILHFFYIKCMDKLNLKIVKYFF